ncbi:hypothetical protein [Natrinema altunense]|uniref:Uncharacterized protein n=1 Tax=Natrinema altunense TaxID=222984 RepID=A0A482XWJ5_9EURY|nr:hypothetical protein [Natrinema altunense]RZH67482.1 hypothetical protein ELS17_11505 [Natrinema altunense]
MDRIRDEINYSGLIGSMILALLLAYLLIINANIISISIVATLFIMMLVNISKMMSKKYRLNKTFYLIGALLSVIAGIITLIWGYILGSAILFLISIPIILDFTYNIK